MVQSSAELDPELTLSLEDIVNTACDFYGIDQSTLIESNHLTLEELGNITGREASGLSKLAARFNTKYLTSADQQNEIFEIKSLLTQMSECHTFSSCI